MDSLKTGIVAAAALALLAGCQSGPQPYDGVVGYKLTKTATGCSVEYVEEVHATYSHLERHGRKLCAQALKVPAKTLATKITVDQAFEQDVVTTVVVPGTTVPTGDTRGLGGGGEVVMSPSTPIQERVIRTLTLQRIVVESTVPQPAATP